MNRLIIEEFEKTEESFRDLFEGLEDGKILITGANGMITTYLSLLLCYFSDKYNLTLYLHCRSRVRAEETYKEFINNEKINIVDFDLETQVPNIDVDYIIHAASPASTKFFVETPVNVIVPNVIGTWKLLNYAKEIGIKKFIFFSSNSIYGEGGIEKGVLNECDYGIVDPLMERSSYIESKKCAEQMCVAYYRQYGVPTTIIRICHTFGPTFDVENDTRIIPRIVNQILNDENITIYRDPNSYTQYTYIADMVTAILIVLLKGEFGEAYNAGGDEIITIEDAISWMVDADERISSKIIRKEVDENYKFGSGSGINFKKISNEKIKQLGWTPLYSCEEGFIRLVKYFLDVKMGE